MYIFMLYSFCVWGTKTEVLSSQGFLTLGLVNIGVLDCQDDDRADWDVFTANELIIFIICMIKFYNYYIKFKHVLWPVVWSKTLNVYDVIL